MLDCEQRGDLMMSILGECIVLQIRIVRLKGAGELTLDAMNAAVA
jgi:hypothetical protein